MPTHLWTAAHYATRSLGRHPFFFLILQVPLLITEFVFRLSMPEIEAIKDEYTKLFYGTTLWTFFFLSSFIVQAATLATVYQLAVSPQIRVTVLFQTLAPRLPQIFSAGVIVGIAVLVGMRAFLLPGAAIFALYLYVPDFTLLPQPVALMGLFRRSWRFAVQQNLSTLGIVAGIGFIFLLSFALDQLLAHFHEIQNGSGIRPLLWDAADLLFSLVAGMWLHTWVAHFFAAHFPERKTG